MKAVVLLGAGSQATLKCSRTQIQSACSIWLVHEDGVGGHVGGGHDYAFRPFVKPLAWGKALSVIHLKRTCAGFLVQCLLLVFDWQLFFCVYGYRWLDYHIHEECIDLEVHPQLFTDRKNTLKGGVLERHILYIYICRRKKNVNVTTQF